MNPRLLALVAAAGSFLLAGVDPAAAQTRPADKADNPTAYTALRLIGKTLGRDALERVVEVTGRDGVPQPFLWKVVLKEGTGSREVDVAGGKIEAQRELTRPPAAGGTTIRLPDLNLDSSGAFDATDLQAHKVKLRYDSLNYALRANPTSGKPTWTLTLLDKAGGEVGTIRLAAHDGTILSTDGRLAGNVPPAASPRPDTTVSLETTAPATTTTTAVRRDLPRETPRPTYRSVPRETTVSRTTTTTTVHRVGPLPTPAATSTATTVTTTQEPIPVATLSDHGDDENADSRTDAGSEQGGLFTRTGRTLDRTSHTVERGFRKAGASVQRFFTGHSDIAQPDRPNLPD